jgi:hypothetical protein
MLAKLIENAGCIPIQRNTTYSEFTEFVAPEVPARRVLQMAVGD